MVAAVKEKSAPSCDLSKMQPSPEPRPPSNAHRAVLVAREGDASTKQRGDGSTQQPSFESCLEKRRDDLIDWKQRQASKTMLTHYIAASSARQCSSTEMCTCVPWNAASGEKSNVTKCGPISARCATFEIENGPRDIERCNPATPEKAEGM